MLVDIVRMSGASALVEVKNPLRRVTIPRDVIKEDGVPEEILDAGIPYGVEWEEVLAEGVTPSQIATSLRKAGIWTEEDLRKSPNDVARVLQMYSLHFGDLVEKLESYQKEVGRP